MAQILWFVLLICVQQSWSQESSSSTEASSDDSDPVALLLSNLRSLVENTGAPFQDGYEFFPLEEERRKEPMYGRPRQDYFKRISENYGKLQKNIGSVLEDLSLHPRKLFGVDVKNKDGSSTVDVKVPFFPVHVKVKNSKTQSAKEPVTQVPGFLEVFHKPKEDSVVEKSTKVGVSIPSLPIDIKVKSKVQPAEPVAEDEDDSKSPEGSRKVRPQLSKVSTKVKVGDIVNVKVKVSESDSKMVKRFGVLPNGWIELGETPGTGRGKRHTSMSKFATDEQKEVFSKAFYDFMADPATDEDPGDVEVDIIDPVNSRILGEVMYSEEAFDNMTKEAVKNLKWALDSDLAPSKIIDKLDAVAKLVLSRRKPKTKSKRTPEDARLQARRDASKLPKMPFSRNEELPAERDVSKEEKTEIGDIEPPRETVVIALTEDGIPVQIRIGPEVENPYRFLHKILSVSQVVLKIQMKEVEADSEAGSEEIPPPVLHVDMSDLKQRTSFLKALRKFRSDQI